MHFVAPLFDFDRLDELIDAAMPGLALWVFALAFCLILYVLIECVGRFRRRSPVEKLLRRRFG